MTEPSANPTFQIALRALLLAAVFVAILLSSYRVGGVATCAATVICSSLVGAIFVILTRHHLGWYSLFVFAAVMIGGTISVEMVARTNEGIWYCARAKRDNSMAGFEFFGGAATGGGFLTGVASALITSIVVNWRRSRNDRESIEDDLSARDDEIQT
jgi:hypothetical protein